jgi:hypothetical protein
VVDTQVEHNVCLESRTRGRMRIRRLQGGLNAALVVAAGWAVVATISTPARAAATALCDSSAYRLSVRSLTGPEGVGAVLVVRISAATADCELPTTLDTVRVTIVARVVDRRQVAAPAAAATISLGRVQRLQRVDATITFGSQIVLKDHARTLLKPDLVLRRVRVPGARLVGRAFNVVATLAEPNPDVGATAIVTVSVAGATVGTTSVRVAPRRRVVIRVATTLTARGRTRLDVKATTDLPEMTMANNRRRAVVEVTEFQVATANVVVPSLAGYGGQFNQHVYAQVSRAAGVTDANVVDMERKMKALRPQFSRIFFTPLAFGDPDRMQSFVRTVLLAQTAGTTIDITWQGGNLDVAGGNVQRLANVLIDLVKNRGVTRLRWLTLQNEPNRTRLTPQQVEAEYRALDPYIQSIRGQVKYMGGDLVRGPDAGAPNQQLWFDYMAQHMAGILDAWSIHVFWNYWDTQKIVDRLTEVRAIWDAEPAQQRKPLYVTEYGVRGLPTFNDARADPGFWSDGTPISQTNVSAFQQAWFDVLSSKLGYVGTSKWDSYFARYDNSTQAYYMIGDPQSGWPLYPLYNFVRLTTSAVARGWSVVGVDSVADTRLVTAYANKNGQRTIVGLDTAGAQLNAASPTAVSYTIGGLPPSRRLHLAIWNETGDGLVPPSHLVRSDPAGVARISVPQQAVFVLTTLRLA